MTYIDRTQFPLYRLFKQFEGAGKDALAHWLTKGLPVPIFRSSQAPSTDRLHVSPVVVTLSLQGLAR